MIRLAMLIALVVVGALSAHAQEMTGAQKDVWNALEEQTALAAKRNWEEMRRHLHPNLSVWGDGPPTPIHINDKSYQYFTKTEKNEVKERYLAPVSVVVVDDVAIINCYSHEFVVNDEGDEEKVIYRLHNTWKKDDGKWKLLATFNSMVASPDDD